MVLLLVRCTYWFLVMNDMSFHSIVYAQECIFFFVVLNGSRGSMMYSLKSYSVERLG